MRIAAGILGVRPIRRLGWAALLLAGAALASAQQPQQSPDTAQQQTSQPQAGQSPPGKTSAAPDPGPSRPWTTPSPLAVPAAQNSNFTSANAARQKELAANSAELLKLATELKAEVDKSNKDTLSLTVIRKAGEIEKLAHGIKEKMKLTASSN